MPIQRLPQDDIVAIFRAGQIDAMILSVDIGKDPENDLKTVETFRIKAEKMLEDFDRRWTVLCDDNLSELTEWASRMKIVREKCDEIDRHLAVKGTRLFNWDTVTSAMGFINAFRVAIEQTLDYNERVVA